MLNLASLWLGLTAWTLGLLSIRKRGSFVLGMGSMGCCGLSLVVQFFEIRRRVAAEDWSALMDIVPTLSWVAAVLLAVTVALNLAAWIRSGKER